MVCSPGFEARRHRTVGGRSPAVVACCAGCGGGRAPGRERARGRTSRSRSRPAFPRSSARPGSELVISVRNAGDQTIPNIAVTVHGFNYRKAAAGATLADPNRPRSRSTRSTRRSAVPRGQGRHAQGLRDGLLDTWACGPLKPGKERLPLVGHGGQGRPLQVDLARRRGAERQGARRERLGRRSRPAAPSPATSSPSRPRAASPTTARPSRSRHASRCLSPPGSRRAAHTPDTARPVAAGTSGSGHRSWSARTARSCCRGCCGSAFGGGRCRRDRRAPLHCPQHTLRL